LKEGYYSLVLHAHLPYVRHKEEGRLEERWLFEAITESYIPLLWELNETESKDVLTISFSPPVLEMLADPTIQERYLDYIIKTEELLGKEKKLAETKEEKDLVSFYINRYQKIKNTFIGYNKNILYAFRELFEKRVITCITCAATHAFLPYVKTKSAIRSQVVEAIRCFEQHFGKKPRGFWLPECAIAPGIDRILVEEGITYTFVDEHAVLNAEPVPSKGSGAPVYSPHGLILFPRHTTLSSKVWSSTLGYPGDVDYREFYRDIAYEREWDYIKPYVHEDGIRIDTGIKHKRITGEGEEKAIYVRKWAEGKIQAHADHFLYAIENEINEHGDQCYPPYLMVTPFDAELFGHWWFEGPEWIGQVIKKGQNRIHFVTPESYIDRHYQDFETSHISFSTWGREGYGDVWINEKNQYLYRHHHRMEADLATVVALFSNPTDLEKRYLKQMVREWMLAVSSDWAFIMDGQSAVQYAHERFATHLSRFDVTKEKLLSGSVQDEWILRMEQCYPFLREIDEQIFFSPHDAYIQTKEEADQEQKRSILMLSWEFPPMMVGGLSRHVFDLSRAMVKEGNEVHVVTSHVDGYPDYEINQGVHVHRIKGLQPEAANFFDWVGSLNIEMTRYIEKLARKTQFDIIHAHDWLVGVTATAIKRSLQLPLLATIHATEHGRNNGIHSELQYEINQKEWELTYEADRVIVCSDYMKEELLTIFSMPEEKLAVIPNGVDIDLLRPYTGLSTIENNNEFTVFSVGRMVKEKGYQTVIDAAALLKERNEKIRFVIAGKGPMLQAYQQQVAERQLDSHVTFLGFVSDEERNEWFSRCDATIFPSYYEPFGIVALEGLAAGKATIVSDTGGLAGIIRHEENGLKMIPGDVQSLATQVLYLYNHPISREALATQGLRDVKSQFNWETIAKQTEDEIEKCLFGELELTI
jgi:1,4-alpha-glucan branching enzyme